MGQKILKSIRIINFRREGISFKINLEGFDPATELDERVDVRVIKKYSVRHSSGRDAGYAQTGHGGCEAWSAADMEEQ